MEFENRYSYRPDSTLASDLIRIRSLEAGIVVTAVLDSHVVQLIETQLLSHFPNSEKDCKAMPHSIKDAEIKDAHLIFNSIWNQLISTYGETNLSFPKEILWLNGAPGAGKGTHTRSIMEFRGLTAKPIVVSDLLQSPEARAIKDAGKLVGDREVSELVFKELLKPENKTGVVIDGYPRTKVQAECVKLLYNALTDLRVKYMGTEFNDLFRKPHFHIVVLFIDQNESVRRQLQRGQEIKDHNRKVEDSGMGEKQELRKTDTSEQAAIERYQTFRDLTYESLKSLREKFHYHFIETVGPFEEVRERMIKEMKYQSSMELDDATNDRLSCIPVADQLARHARQKLVSRLDGYEEHHTELFKEVVDLIRDYYMPIIERHVISGLASINSEHRIFENPLAIAMLIDIFSERGFNAMMDIHKVEVPIRVNADHTIECVTKRVYRTRITFPTKEIRRSR